MILVKLTLVLLPFIAFLSNYFKVNNLPEGVLMLTPTFLLLFSLILPTKHRTQSAITPRIVISAFFTYIFVSSMYVVLDTPEAGIKPILVQGVSYAICIWLLVSNHMNREKLTQNFLLYCKSIAIVAVIYILFVIPILLAHEGGRGWAFVSTELLPNRNDMSLFFLVGLCGFVFLEFQISKQLKLAAALTLVLALLLTFSRSSYISLFVLSIYFIFNSKHKFWMLAAMLIAFILIISIEGNPIINRLEYTFSNSSQGQYDDSTSLRVTIWEHALKLGFENPVFGVGHGRSPFWNSEYSGEHAGHILFAHNYFITQFFQLGIVGLLLTFAIFLMLLAMAKQLPKSEKYFVYSTVILFLIMSISGDPMYGYSKFIFILLYSSLLNSTIRANKHNLTTHYRY